MSTWDPKDPNEVLDYNIDWSDRLVAGDTLVASEWLPPPSAGLVLADDSFGLTATVIWVSGGIEGHTYKLVNRVTTQAGRVMDQTGTLRIRSK